jgi:hypothetical protein
MRARHIGTGIARESFDGAFLEDIPITGHTRRHRVDAPLFRRLHRRHRHPNETVRAGTLRRVLMANLVSDDAASTTASILAGIRRIRWRT